MSITELAQRTKINAGHLSRIENGLRPPTARVATALDSVFSDRRGWYLQWFDDIRAAPEIPATFKDWSDYEDQSATLRAWTPGMIDGLAQTEDYARGLISVETGIDAATMEARVRARMARQQRVLLRKDPPRLILLVDAAALYRRVSSAAVMAGQLRHLIEMAARPTVTLQVMPEIEHASVASGYLIADDAVWSENVVVGGTYTAAETYSDMAARFDSLRGECYRVSESLALLGRLEQAWSTGGLLATRLAQAVSA